VAVELIHNLSLLHDDVIDGDDIRRGRPSVWALFGTGASIVAGDALWATANQVLLAVEGTSGRAAVGILNDTVSRIIRAGADDFGFERHDAADIDLDDYLKVSEVYGGELLGCAAVLGTILCGGKESDAEGLRRAAHCAGTAWQAVNDLENLWGTTLWSASRVSRTFGSARTRCRSSPHCGRRLRPDVDSGSCCVRTRWMSPTCGWPPSWPKRPVGGLPPSRSPATSWIGRWPNLSIPHYRRPVGSSWQICCISPSPERIARPEFLSYSDEGSCYAR
jgi:Polyprenyl synthetase